MFTLTLEKKGPMPQEFIGLFREPLAEKGDEAFRELLKVIEQNTKGLAEENKITEALSLYEAYSSQCCFEDGMRMGARLMLALLKDGVVA